ncbi:hypothetical protein J4217_03040 [Candidatus Pacearchaeota archaeon]|nr:hypothetical protein [Candidatus Pacearchaeota archaeon]
MEIKKSIVYGILSGLGILLFFLAILTTFKGYGIAVYEFKRLWYWLIPLAIGFGTQIGLYFSIKHDAIMKAGVKASGTVSGGSMVVCCSHYLLSIIPIIGVTGLTEFLMAYQKGFFAIGITSSIAGILLMLNHKRKMKGGLC